MYKTLTITAVVVGAVFGSPILKALASPPSVAGRVLVLENERTLTGEIEQIGDQYRIKRLIGETIIPASRVLKLCDSLDEAYQFLKTRANLNDPDERMRLSDWCRQRGLREQACEEAEAALKLQPGNARIQRLAKHLREALERPAEAPAAMPEEESSLPAVEVSTESLSMFATRVQPILMNTCVNCHTAGRGGSFQLMRVSGHGIASRKSLEKNLAAVLSQINARQPESSKLLTKAISIHGPGMIQAPIKSREAAPYRSLEFWVYRTVATNPHLRDDAPTTTTTTASMHEEQIVPASFGADRMPNPTSPAATVTTAAIPPTTTPVRPDETIPPAARTEESRPSTEAKPPTGVVDPVDPEAFNQEFHLKPPPGKQPGR